MAKENKIFSSMLILISVLFAVFQVEAASNSGITYHGRLIGPNGQPVTSSAVQFRIQVRTPTGEDCLMYEEVQTLNMSGSSGAFALTLNDGSGTRTDASGYLLPEIFANRGTAFAFSPASCSLSTTYTPSFGQGRKLKVFFNDGTFAGWETLPSMDINYSPMAIESMQVGGFQASHLLRVQDGSGVPQTVSAMSPAQFTQLFNLSNITGVATGDSIKWNGTAWVPYAAGTGASLVEADIPNLTTAGKVSGSAINAGTIGGSTAINTTGAITTTNNLTAANISTTTASVKNVEVYKSDNSQKVTITVPAGLGVTYTLTLPADDGTPNQVLRTDGNGNLSWVNDAGITSESDPSVSAWAKNANLAASDVPNLDAAKVATGVLGTARLGTGTADNTTYLRGDGTWTAVPAGLAIGTTAGTAAEGNDSRITGAAQKSANLSDLANAGTARTNLGLGTAATKAFGTSAGNLVELDGSGRLPAVDGSQLTNLPAGSKWAESGGNVSRSTGNIGMGTSNPTHKLDVNLPAGAEAPLRITSGSVSAVRMDSDSANADARNYVVGSNVVAYGDFQIAQSNTIGGNPVSAGTSRFYIDNVGQVGIGTTSPTHKLHVVGDVNITGNFKVNGTNINSGTVSAVSSANNYITVGTGSTTPLITANVGTGANTLAAGDDSRITGAVQGTAYAADLTDAASCGADAKPAWSSGLDKWVCASIGSLNASTISAGTINSARLGSGTADGTTYLRGDGTWATIPGGLTVGTTAGTAAEGNDSRITGAAQKSANLSDLANAGTARTNLGLGTAATKAFGTSAGNLVELDGSGRLPAVDGSQLTNLPAGSKWTEASGNVYRTTGNVGIGTTSPQMALHVSSSAVNTGMIVRNTNTASGASVPLFLASDSYGTLTNVSIENLGPNTTHPGGMLFRTGATSESGFGTDRMFISNNGNIGMGTASPSANLHVDKPSASVIVAGDGGASTLAMGNRDSVAATLNSGNGAYRGIQSANGNMLFGLVSVTTPTTMYQTDLFIQNDGLVGIGKTNPGYKLDVAGDINISGNFKVNGTNINSGTVSTVSSANNYITVTNGSTTPSITANVGTGANTLAAGDDSRITGAVQGTAYAADLTDAASCGADAKPAWSSGLDKWVCASIGSLNASTISAGTINSARLGSGTADGTTYLRGDGTWAAIPGGLTVGTTAGTAAEGNDSRITGAAQKSANLSDLANAATARTNLGLGTAATKAYGTAAGELVELDGGAKIPASLLPSSVVTTSSSLAGDVSGTSGSNTVDKIKGTAVSITSLASNHILQYNGTNYVNRLIPTCSAGNYLTFNGTSWSCAADAGSGTIGVGSGGTGLTAGTSGGIPYYASSSTMTSSGALTANGVVLGGGAGSSPTTTAAGTANQVLRIPSGGGAPAFGSIDLSSSAVVGTSILPAANLPTSVVVNNGNALTADLTVGTNDAYSLKFETNNTTQMTMNSSGNVGINRAPSATAKVDVTGSIVSRTNIISSGAAVNLALANNHLLKSVGTTSIALSNITDGGAYTLIISDTTSRTYTFTGCTNSYFNPANGPTTASSQSTYTILVAVDGANTNCYISWMTGFQ